jgi:uncharacterized protein (TIGR04255 family)
LRFRDTNDRLAETDLDPKFWQKLRESFPVKRDPEEAVLSGEQDWQELRTSNTHTSVTLNSGAAFIISAQPRFESWEDSFKPYLSTVIDAYQAIQPNAQVEQAVLGFNNRLYLPAEIELSDYFHTLPAAPPNVVPPRFMRDNNLAYAFPARVMKGSYSTDLLYDSGSHFLRCSFDLEPTHSGLQVDLDLELHWHRPFMIEAAMSIFHGMKNNVYVAFHRRARCFSNCSRCRLDAGSPGACICAGAAGGGAERGNGSDFGAAIPAPPACAAIQPRTRQPNVKPASPTRYLLYTDRPNTPESCGF